MISFAGGLPAPETFPEVRLSRLPRESLQYGPTEGDTALREHVAERLRDIGLPCGFDQVLVLSGSQQGIDLVAKLFVDPGTRVAVESPTYLAALQVFRFYGADFTTLRRDSADSGMAADAPSALAYVTPTFQNPTGYCYTAAERAALARSCDERSVPLFEDDPYRDLAYEPCERRPICGQLKRASWVYQGSFSKSLAPGLRLGFLASSPDLIPHLTRLKQAADLHSSRVSQWLALEQLRDRGAAQRLRDVVGLYRRKRDRFARSLEKHFAGLATWQLPPGGLFFWLRLNRAIDSRSVLPDAVSHGVAFMPGEYFYTDQREAIGTIRLNFSHAGDEQAETGLGILAELLAAAPDRESAARDRDSDGARGQGVR